MATDTVPIPPTPPGMTDEDFANLCAAQIKWNKAKRDLASRNARDAATPPGFRTSHEAMFVPGDHGCSPPALLINPAANVQSLVCAAHSRAVRLQQSLSSWAASGNAGCVTVDEVAYSLEPLAEEVSLLLEELASKVGRSSSANSAEAAS